MLGKLLYLLACLFLIWNIIGLCYAIYIYVIKRKKVKLYEVTIKDKWNNVDYIICRKYKIKKNKFYLYGISEYNHYFSFLELKTYSLTYIVHYDIKDISR